MECSVYRFPGSFKTFEPLISGRFVAHFTPKSLLHIQTRLIRWPVPQAKFSVGLDKDFHLLPSMSPGSIHIKPNLEAPQMPIKMLQTFHKVPLIPSRGPDQSLSTQQGSHPAKDIEPFLVLTGGGDTQSLPLLRPTDPQARVQREPRFILKHNRLINSQGAKFFLTPCGIVPHPPTVPEDTNNWPALGDTPVDASNIEPDVPSALFQSAALSAPPKSGHPNAPDSV